MTQKCDFCSDIVLHIANLYIFFLYNTLLKFLIKLQVVCDGTDVLVVQPGYRLISIADKYHPFKKYFAIINNIIILQYIH